MEERGTRALLGTVEEVEEEEEDEARVAIWLMTTSMGSIEIPRVAVMGAVVGTDVVVDDELSMDMSLMCAPAACADVADLDPLLAFRRKIALAFSFDSLSFLFQITHRQYTRQTQMKKKIGVFISNGQWTAEQETIQGRRE
jgi:hypothetical protein